MKANQKLYGSAEDDKKNFFLLFIKVDSLDTMQPTMSEILTNRI
jgi:hypothetical protein